MRFGLFVTLVAVVAGCATAVDDPEGTGTVRRSDAGHLDGTPLLDGDLPADAHVDDSSMTTTEDSAPVEDSTMVEDTAEIDTGDIDTGTIEDTDFPDFGPDDTGPTSGGPCDNCFDPASTCSSPDEDFPCFYTCFLKGYSDCRYTTGSGACVCEF